MKKVNLILVLILGAIFSLFSQKNSYKIDIKIIDVPDSVLYLVGHYGNHTVCIDTALVNKKFSVQFTGNEPLPSGIYAIQNKDQKNYIELIIDKQRYFSVSTSMAQLMKKREYKGSEENELFFEVQKAAFLNVLIPISVKSIIEQFSNISPNTLLSKYLKAILPLKIPDEIEKDSIKTLQYRIEHFFDDIDINDIRLLHVPFVAEKVLSYFVDVLPQEPTLLNHHISTFLDNIENKEVFNFYLEQLFQHYSGYGIDCDLDAVAVNLYDSYCVPGLCCFISPDFERIIWKKIDRKRKLLPGQPIPPIEAYNENGVLIRTNELSCKFTIIWFWEPDCGSCIELTPVLNDFYHTYKPTLDFEVYAIALTDDEQTWKEFIEEHHLDWVNVSFAHGDMNYDLINYFDIMTTPCLVLIDSQHKILSRQLSFDKMKIIMSQ